MCKPLFVKWMTVANIYVILLIGWSRSFEEIMLISLSTEKIILLIFIKRMYLMRTMKEREEDAD